MRCNGLLKWGCAVEMAPVPAATARSTTGKVIQARASRRWAPRPPLPAPDLQPTSGHTMYPFPKESDCASHGYRRVMGIEAGRMHGPMGRGQARTHTHVKQHLGNPTWRLCDVRAVGAEPGPAAPTQQCPDGHSAAHIALPFRNARRLACHTALQSPHARRPLRFSCHGTWSSRRGSTSAAHGNGRAPGVSGVARRGGEGVCTCFKPSRRISTAASPSARSALPSGGISRARGAGTPALPGPPRAPPAAASRQGSSTRACGDDTWPSTLPLAPSVHTTFPGQTRLAGQDLKQHCGLWVERPLREKVGVRSEAARHVLCGVEGDAVHAGRHGVGRRQQVRHTAVGVRGPRRHALPGAAV